MPIRVVHLEDNVVDSDYLASLLEQGAIQAELIRVESESAYLDALQQGNIDLIISDYNLPAFDGHRALKAALAASPDTPFIFFSGTIGEDWAVECLKQGAADYVVKDRPQRLVSAITRALDQKDERRRRQDAERARASEIKFREAIEQSVPAGITALDLNGRCIYANRAFCDLVGWSEEELLGDLPPFRYWPPEYHAEIRENFQRALAGNAPASGYEMTFIHRTGRRFPVHGGVSPLRDGTGHQIGWIFTALDISERVRARENLEESNRRLNEALAGLQQAQREQVKQERMNALAQMVGGIVHDFNNSLMPLIGIPEYLLHQSAIQDESGETQEMLQAMLTAASDARDVVRRLREFYRPDEGVEVRPFQIGDLVARAVTLTEPIWRAQAESEGRSIRMETECGNLPPVLGNESSLREMLANLIINASHAIASAGTIRLSATQEGDVAVLKISDSGCGMSEEVRRRCFEPFFTTKGEKGTGLGLAMCYGIVQRHGGSVELESEVGRGTTFIIRLPIQGPPGARLIEDKTPLLKISRPLRILAVDDSSTARSLIRRYLKAEGHHIDTAATGAEALKLLVAQAYDILITDRAMPGMTGDDVASSAKALRPGLPIIMLSGFGDLMHSKTECPPGIDTVISKPVTPDELLAAIARVLETHPPQ